MLVLLCMNLWGKNPHAAVISQPLIHTSNQNFILKPFEQCLDHVALEARRLIATFIYGIFMRSFYLIKLKPSYPFVCCNQIIKSHLSKVYRLLNG